MITITFFATTLLQNAPQCFPCGTAFDAGTAGGALLLLAIVLPLVWGTLRNAAISDGVDSFWFIFVVALIILAFTFGMN